MMDALIDQVERELVEVQPDREATFADAVRQWREWAEHTKRLKPATLRNYDALLAPPSERPRRGGQRLARIMRAFGDRRIAEVTPAEVERFLRRLDREGLPGRSVNSHRQALANVFECAARPDGFARCRTTRCAGPTSAARTTPSRRRPSRPSRSWRSRAPRGRASTSMADGAGPAPRRTSSNSASTNRTLPSMSSPGSPGCARASYGRSAGARSASRTGRSSSSPRCPPEWTGRPSRANGAPFRSPVRRSSSWTSSAAVTGSRGPATSSSAVRRATRSTTPLCAAASGSRVTPPACPRCPSTTCATPSPRSPSAVWIPLARPLRSVRSV